LNLTTPKQPSLATKIPARFLLKFDPKLFAFTKRPAFGSKFAREDSWEGECGHGAVSQKDFSFSFRRMPNGNIPDERTGNGRA
jgi:hypothetical protein